MKKFWILILCTVLNLSLLRAQGIEFFHGAWSEALAKAKADNKLIFVDAYASWCGPCKMMSNKIFPDASVGEFYNSNFLCLKIDMEKPENAEFAGKYPVSAYPTLLFIDADGKVVLKDVGAKDVSGLLDFGRKAITKSGPAIDFEKLYNEGNRDPQFLMEYVRYLNRIGKPSLKITNEYLNSQKDLSTETNLRFIYEGVIEADSRVYDLLVQYKDKIAALVGREALESRAATACKNTVKKAVEFKNEALLTEAKNKMNSISVEKGRSFAYEADLRYYTAVKDPKKYLKAAQQYQKTDVKQNAARLNDLVVTMLRAFPDDAAVLNQAEKWAKTAAQTGGLPDYYMNLADIYKKKGDKEKARASAKKAIEAIGDKDNGMKAKIEHFINTL